MNYKLLLATSCALVSLSSSAVMAQSIDYGSMQELFGESVTTSATGKPQRISDVPVTMEILTADDIRRSGAVNLPEVLRQVNGVNIVQSSTQGYDVSVRGYNQPFSQRLLVLVNGRQVYLDHYGYTAWSTIPVQLEEIRQIEVVKGPNTALFGFNAVSGVVNIVTFNPLYDDVSSAGITVGTQDFRKAHYVQSLKLSDKIGVRVSAGKRESDAFDSSFNGFGAVDVVDPEQESLNLDAMYQMTDKSQVRLELSGSNTSQNDGISTTTFSSDYETKSAKLSYELDSDWGLIKASAYKNFLDWEYSGSVGSGDLDNEVLVVQLEDTIQLNNDHTLRLQGEYRENIMTSNGVLAPDAEISYQVYAAGGMWNWNINDKFSWTNALRIDHLQLDHNGVFTAGNPFSQSDYDRNITEFSYNSGVVWKASENDTFRLSTARGLEVPSLLGYGLDAANGPVTIIGKPDLDPAIVTNYELAWDRKVDFVENGLFRAAIFHQKTQDVKTLQSDLAFPLYNSDNIGDSTAYGIEASLDGSIGENFDWGLGYIYQNTNDDLDNTIAGVQSSAKEYEKRNPEHQLNLKLGYNKGAWEADTLVYYASGTEHTTGDFSFDDVDSYIGINARVGYTFDNDVTLAVSALNAQSASVETSPNPDIERRMFVSLSKKF